MAGSAVRSSILVDPKSLKKVVVALRSQGDREAAREFTRQLRAVAEPGLIAVRQAILAMDSQERDRNVGSLRAALAKQTKISVRTTGRRPGVSIRTLKTGMPRGFTKAARHTQAAAGWRKPVFRRLTKKGRLVDVWAHQVGAPGWFDTTLEPLRPAGAAAARAVLEAQLTQIAERAKI